jgi:hypothetical protein
VNVSRLAYSTARVRRHAGWIRADGVRRIIEEDELDLVARLRVRGQRWSWRRQEAAPRGSAAPVLVVGVQRSGTNMVMRSLQAAPEVETRNENDRRAFRRFELRPDDEVLALVARSRHRFVALKPLCDAHRTAHLLEHLRVREPGRAIWVYRDVDGRARSAVRKFCDANLLALRRVAEGATGIWQAGGLGPAERDLLRSFDYATMSATSAAALFWYVRNSLFFRQRLEIRDDVLLLRYEDIVRAPAETLRTMSDFLGLSWRPAIAGHVDARNTGREAALEIDPQVRRLCDDLTVRLDHTVAHAGVQRVDRRDERVVTCPLG